VIRAVLFDLGDTLFRLLPMADVTDEFARLLETEGFEDAETEAARILETFRERLMAGYQRGDLVEPAIAEVVAPFIGADARARKLAGALDDLLGEADIARWEQAMEREQVFDELHSRGLRVGYVSNTLTSADRMRRRLDEFDLLGHAKVAVFSVEQRVRKPNPEIYRAALRALEVEPEEALFIGDRVREDVRGPQAVGMRGVLTHEFRQEDPGDSAPMAVVGHLAELPGLIAEA
jgi:HAD superfamily hydrolase (TIGR01662 family)